MFTQHESNWSVTGCQEKHTKVPVSTKHNKSVPSVEGAAQRLREVRASLGLTQDELAQRVGVTRQTQSSYELGRTPIDLDYLGRLAEAGGDWVYVVFGDGMDPSVQPDHSHELLFRVLWWADEFCRDRRGTPLPASERIPFIVDAYFSLLKKQDRAADADELPKLLRRHLPA